MKFPWWIMSTIMGYGILISLFLSVCFYFYPGMFQNPNDIVFECKSSSMENGIIAVRGDIKNDSGHIVKNIYLRADGYNIHDELVSTAKSEILYGLKGKGIKEINIDLPDGEIYKIEFLPESELGTGRIRTLIFEMVTYVGNSGMR